MTETAVTTIADLILDRGLAQCASEASALVRRGRVLVNGERVYDPDAVVSADAALRITTSTSKYASRAGVKLEHALRNFDIEVEGKTCVDIGASTGGFTDCLLGFGARRVYAVDVGYGILDWELRIHPRAVVIERFNARYLSKTQIPEVCDIATIDVNHISIIKLIDPVFSVISDDGSVIALVKPQFEISRELACEPGFVRGVIRDESLAARVMDDVKSRLCSAGVSWERDLESPITGTKGNREFFALLSRRA